METNTPKPQKARGMAPWKIAVPLLAVAALATAAYFIFFHKSPEQKAAEADQEYYEELVDDCRSALREADRFADLTKAEEEYFEEIEELEDEHGSVMPDVYDNLADLEDLRDEHRQDLRDDCIEKAEEYIDDEQYADALGLYNDAISALPDDEELLDLRTALAAKIGFIDVQDILYGNEDTDGNTLTTPGATLYTDDMRYLSIWVVYNSLLPEDEGTVKQYFTYRLYYPDGHLDTSGSSPTGYTYGGSFYVAHGEVGQREKLAAWGVKTHSNYPVGVYRLELFYDGHKLFENEFTVEP